MMGKRTITAVNVVDVEKRRMPSKHYVYVMLVTWSDGIGTQIYRRYSVFFDLQCKLFDLFPEHSGSSDPTERIIPFLPGKKYLGRSHIRKVALERLQPINEYCQSLVALPPEISQCPEVVNFFSVDPDDVNPPTEEKKWKADKISGPKMVERYIVVADYTAEKPGEVNLTEGMLIAEVMEKSQSGWWFVSTQDSQGWAPSTYLAREDGEADAPVFKAERGKEEKYLVTQDYQRSGEDELSVLKGDLVDVIEKHMNGWWLVRHETTEGSAEGWVPATYLNYHPVTHRHSLSLAPQNVEVIGNLSEISQFFKRTDSAGSRKQPPPRTGSLPRGRSPVSASVSATYVTVAEFCDKVGDGISFHVGEDVKVLEKTSTGWWYIEIAGEEGWAPASYIEPTGTEVTPKQSPVHELSSFESDDSFTSEDSPAPIRRTPNSRPPPNTRTTPNTHTSNYVTRPLSFDEAVAGKAKADCGESVPSHERHSRQVGREARRNSGSVPSTPTNDMQHISLQHDTNKYDRTPGHDTSSRHDDRSDRPSSFQLPVNEIKNLLGEGGKPFHLKQVDKSKISGIGIPPTPPRSQTNQKPVPIMPINQKSLPPQPQIPVTNQKMPPKIPVTPNQKPLPKAPEVPSKPSTTNNNEISDVHSALKSVSSNRTVDKPLPQRPLKPIFPQKSMYSKETNDQLSLNDALQSQLSKRLSGENPLKTPPNRPNPPINSSSNQETDKLRTKAVMPLKSTTNTPPSIPSRPQDIHANISPRAQLSISPKPPINVPQQKTPPKTQVSATPNDLASALKARLEKTNMQNKPAIPSTPPNLNKPTKTPSDFPQNGHRDFENTREFRHKPPDQNQNTKPSPIPKPAQKPAKPQKPAPPQKPAQPQKPTKPNFNVDSLHVITSANGVHSGDNEGHIDETGHTPDLQLRDNSGKVLNTEQDPDVYSVIGDLDGINEGEISLREGTTVRVHQRDSTGWWYVGDGVAEGWAPRTYLESLSGRDSVGDRSSAGDRPSKPPKPQMARRP